MTREFDSYIPEVKALNLQAGFEGQVSHAREVLGSWVTRENPTDRQLERTRDYLHSPLRDGIDRHFRMVFNAMVGRRITRLLVREVERLDPSGPGRIVLQVGFSEDRMVDEEKIRTLKSGARQEMLKRSPFKGALYQRDGEYLHPFRISSDFSKVLRSGLDELPQFENLRTVSPRGLLSEEILSRKILSSLRYVEELGFSQKTRDIISKHRGIMVSQGVQPGIINARSALRLENTSALLRFYLDEQYAMFIGPLDEMRLGIIALSRRGRQFAQAAAILGVKSVLKAPTEEIF